MYNLATPEQVRKIDLRAIEEYNIPSIILMENAGHELYDLISQKCKDKIGRKCLIACGTGNNGGDGLVAARLLSHNDYDCSVFIFGSPDKMSEDFKTNLRIFENSFPEKVAYVEKLSKEEINKTILSSDIILDAIFGIGFHGNLPDTVKRFNTLCLSSRAIKFSADVPSGVDSLTGKADPESFKADFTVTFGIAKPGLFLSPALDFRGELFLGNIGIPPHILKDESFKDFLVGIKDIKKFLLPRKRNVHKGSFGKLLVISGSRGMYGAPLFCSRGALLTGTGSVTLAIPENIEPIIAPILNEIMSIPLKCDNDGGISPQQELSLDDFDCVILGPGLGKKASTGQFVRKIFSSCRKTLIVDADGINLLDEKTLMEDANADLLILTPHAGELSRLSNIPKDYLIGNTLEYRKLSKKYNSILIGKGANPFIVFPNGNIFYTNVSNSGMAVAGMGDLLCGIIAGFLCEGKNRRNHFDSIIAGVFFHSYLGDFTKKTIDERCLTPSAMMDNISDAFRELELS